MRSLMRWSGSLRTGPRPRKLPCGPLGLNGAAITWVSYFFNGYGLWVMGYRPHPRTNLLTLKLLYSFLCLVLNCKDTTFFIIRTFFSFFHFSHPSFPRLDNMKRIALSSSSSENRSTSTCGCGTSSDCSEPLISLSATFTAAATMRCNSSSVTVIFYLSCRLTERSPLRGFLDFLGLSVNYYLLSVNC